MRVKRDLIQKIFMGVGIGMIKRELMKPEPLTRHYLEQNSMNGTWNGLNKESLQTKKDINEFIENFKTDLSKQYFSDVINNWGIIPKVSTDTSQSVPEKDPNIIIKRGRAGTPYEGQYFIHNKATNKTTKATYEELQKYHTVQ